MGNTGPVSGKSGKGWEISSIDSHERLTARPLRKHVALVHSNAESLSLAKRKLTNLFLQEASLSRRNGQGRTEEGYFRTHTKDIAAVMGVTSRNITWLKNQLRGLQDVALELNLLHDDVPELDDNSDKDTESAEAKADKGTALWERCILFPSVRIERNGEVLFRVNPDIEDLVLKPSVYAYINLQEMLALKRKHGQQLYEVLCRFIGTGSTGWVDYSDWLRLFAGPKKTSAPWSWFEKDILIPALEDVAEHTGFKVRVELNQRGRKVTSVRFLFSHKNSGRDALAEIDPSALRALKRAGLGDSDARSVAQCGSTQAVIKATEDFMALNAAGKIRYAAKWLRTRVQNLDKAPSPSGSLAPPQDAPGRSTGSVGQGSEQDAEDHVDLEALPEQQVKDLWARFESSASGMTKIHLESGGADHPIIKEEFRLFVGTVLRRQREAK
ncbi:MULTISPECIES: replication initiation protein [unclassified Thioalkalivibrio]|uniref:replication initiation protein n=1 Tax=unclassified Thioalkalivibrio TaxID=2621013 RepID=UPI0003721370|nr:MULTISPECIES: replication initiation protein [unclassified Thioalkalivibrio]